MGAHTARRTFEAGRIAGRGALTAAAALALAGGTASSAFATEAPEHESDSSQRQESSNESGQGSENGAAAPEKCVFEEAAAMSPLPPAPEPIASFEKQGIAALCESTGMPTAGGEDEQASDASSNEPASALAGLPSMSVTPTA